MSRTKKNKVFDLFKRNFKITFFYKPSMNGNDVFYYITLDEVIGIRARLFNKVLVIDSVSSITSSYVKPLYEKIIDCLVNQTELSVLVSIIGNTSVLQQISRVQTMPIIDDDRYITVSNEFYRKIKSQFRDESKYGFYLLAVHEEDSIDEADEEPVTDEYIPREIDVQQPIERLTLMDNVKGLIRSELEDIIIEEISETVTRFIISEKDTFNIRTDGDAIYIEELLDDIESTFNLIKINQLMSLFERLLSLSQNVYIMKVTNDIVYNICKGKGYDVMESAKEYNYNKHMPQNIMHNFGSYKIVIRNYN